MSAGGFVEREANYVAVGSFVLLVLAMGALFVYWYSGSRHAHHFRRYEIYFDGSVSGLSVGGPVRYLGVDVGRVESLRIDPRSPERVQVTVDIEQGTPISKRTVAELLLQGITGLLYIDLQQLPANSPLPVLANARSEHYPVIPSVHSDFDRFLSSLPELTTRLNDLADRAGRLLSNRNLESVTRVLTNLDQATAGLPASARKVDALIAQLSATVAEAHQVVGEIQGTSHAAGASFVSAVQRLQVASDQLARASRQLNRFVSENRGALSGFLQSGLPQIEGLVRDGRKAAQQIGALSRSLRQNPSQLFYQQAPSGVAIPP